MRLKLASPMIMNPIWQSRSGRFGFLAGSAGMFLLVASAALGFWLGSSQPSRYAQVDLQSVSTAASGSNMAVATGQISDEAEGVFFLDFVTGDLQCLVYYPRLGAFGARYYTNVQAQLPGAGRGAQYLMVTGNAVGARSSSNLRPANCLVYITDVNSGTFAAYVVPWNKSAESSSQAQGGPLLFVGGGPIRNYSVAASAPQPLPIGNPPAAANNNGNNPGNPAVNGPNAQVQGGPLGGNPMPANNGGNAKPPANNMNGNGGLGNGGLGNGGLGNGGLGNGGLGNGGLGNRNAGANDAGGAAKQPKNDRKSDRKKSGDND